MNASEALLASAAEVIPGGVNTCRRRSDPRLCFRSGAGAYLEDLDGRRYLDYHAAVLGCLPPGAFHVLPLMGVHPQFQGQHYGEQLLEALHNWCAADTASQGLVIDTGNARYLNFYERQGYKDIGQVAIGPVVEHVFFHPAPRRVEASGG